MIAIITLLLAFPLGFLLRSRTSAILAYVAVYGYCFAFQNVYLMRDWVENRSGAFPADAATFPAEYLVVTAVIYLLGLGLVAVGHRFGTRRRNRLPGVDLDRARA
ncbi:hypothetical protein [Kribbella sp. NPDC023855]|uniref:hypothetical protein n=1 Tax=Kribbella sp. NPDC023855 TaxID=3154698 RepID=UPI0033C4C4B1